MEGLIEPLLMTFRESRPMAMRRWLGWCGMAAGLLGGATLAAPAAGEEKPAAPAGDEAGWVTLFDGTSMEGWKASENKDSWTVEDGAFKCHGPRSHLFYVGKEAPFTDFVVSAQVKTTPGSNSGIYISTKYQEEGWPKYGYEAQVNNTGKDPKKTGSLYGVKDVAEQHVPDDQWYTQTVTVKGRHIEIAINGKTVVSYDEPEGKEAFDKNFERRLTEGGGTFALQAHDPDSVVYFKDIKVKKLAE